MFPTRFLRFCALLGHAAGLTWQQKLKVAPAALKVAPAALVVVAAVAVVAVVAAVAVVVVMVVRWPRWSGACRTRWPR